MDTWLTEYHLKPECLEKDKAADLIDELSTLIRKVLGIESELVHKSFNNGIIAFFTAKSGETVLLRGNKSVNLYPLLTIDISTPKIDDSCFKVQLSEFNDKIKKMSFVEELKTPGFLPWPSLKRGRLFSKYDLLTGLLVERDFKGVHFDDVSPYQHVRIMDSPQYGGCLFLDNDLNLSESDLEYTRAITGYDKEDYKDKNVLILGGGDGGILHYLRDRGPSMITMIDIDQMVIDAAKIHLRGICHDALDSLSGENYEVIVDDCVKYLKKYVAEKKKFDYIINDLTAIPVSTEPVGDHWDFLRLILSMSMKVLKNDGKYFTQGNSLLAQNALAMYETQLEKLECRVKYTKKEVCVPSYLEQWVFYTIWKDS
ncbi:spermine synthase-like [Styela clava]